MEYLITTSSPIKEWNQDETKGMHEIFFSRGYSVKACTNLDIIVSSLGPSFTRSVLQTPA